ATTTCKGFDLHCYRRTPHLKDLRIATHLVANEDWALKAHRVAIVTTRPLARRTATALPARSICDKSQPPKISPCALANTAIAIARSASSDSGKDLDAFLTAIGIRSDEIDDVAEGRRRLCRRW